MKPHFIVHALVRVYPPAWRLEYGDELELMLVRRPLTVGIVCNVFAHGIWQRLRFAPIWKLGGATLALKMVIGTIVNSIWPLTPTAYNRFFTSDLAIAFAVGCFAVLRDRRNIRSAMGSAAMAATLGVIPEVILGLLWAANLVHPTILGLDGSPFIVGHGVTFLCFRGQPSNPLEVLPSFFLTLPFCAVPAGVMGLLGGSIAKIAGAIGKRLQKEE